MRGKLLIDPTIFGGLPALKVSGAQVLLDGCAQGNGGGVPSRAGADPHINIPPGGILLCILICLLKSAFFPPTEQSRPAAVSLWRRLNQISISASDASETGEEPLSIKGFSSKCEN